MKSITLSATGLKFSAAFNTIVSKVISPKEKSSIVIAAAPNVEISLGDNSAEALGISKDTHLSIKPIDGSSDNSFTLEVLEKPQAKKTSEPVSTRSSGAARSMNLHDF